MILITIVLVIILAPLLFWLFCFFYQHDFSVPLLNPQKYKKVLAIFPHPDDEVATIGGILHLFSSFGAKVYVSTMTHGEAGETCITLHEPIGTVRAKELEDCVKVLGASSLILDNFGDGKLVKKKELIEDRVDQIVSEINPDLVITFDTSGLYGHPDHICLAERVTEVIRTSFPNISLWYTTETKRVYDHIHLPVQMAKDPEFIKRRTAPTYRIWVGRHVIARTRALYCHRCQLGGFKKSLPIRILPIWFFSTQRLFEYVHEVQVSD